MEERKESHRTARNEDDNVSAVSEYFQTYPQIRSGSLLCPFSCLNLEEPDEDKRRVTVVRVAVGYFPPRERVRNGGGFQEELGRV